MSKHIYCQHSSDFSIPFFDVDGMQIVWHGNYIKYLEMARCEFLDSIAYNYLDMEKDGFSWPIVKLEIKYIKPAHFGQKISVQLAVIEYESCLKIQYKIIDKQSLSVLTQAMTMQVPVKLSTGETQLETPVNFRQSVQACRNFYPLISK